MTNALPTDQPIEPRVAVLLDSNVFLDIYKAAPNDLEQLSKLREFISTGRVTLLSCLQVKQEIRRNREKVIDDALKGFDTNWKFNRQMPGILRSLPGNEQLAADAKALEKNAKALLSSARAEASSRRLPADELIAALIAGAHFLPQSTEIESRAKRRKALGNPPGKSGSLGDAVIWESLLDGFSNDSPLHLVSGDGDYASALSRGALKDFLQQEWDERFSCEIAFHQTLRAFFAEVDLEVDLSDDYEEIETSEPASLSGSQARNWLALRHIQTDPHLSEAIRQWEATELAKPSVQRQIRELQRQAESVLRRGW